MGDPNLVTTCSFHGQEYLFKMNVLGNNLEILITNKNSGEEWQCSYDATYIENLTHKTGNFKQFDIFVTMVKSGLLRTSECISLDLLTFEDLEMLRSRKITKVCGPNNSNRRYLIITYCVEFDKIRYPLPLEYCGPPDPLVLQSTIRRLEMELSRMKDEVARRSHSSESRKIYFLQKRVDELTDENVRLQEEVSVLSKRMEKKPRNQVLSLQKAMDKLERSVVNERNSHHDLVEKLRTDKMMLAKELERLKWSERNLKLKLKDSPTRMCRGDHQRNPTGKRSDSSLNTVYRRENSPGVESVRAKALKISRIQKQEPWDSPIPNQRRSRKDTLKIKTNRSRSSSGSSVKYQEPVAKYDPVEPNYVSPSHSRMHSPVDKFHSQSRGSSVASKRSNSKESVKIKPLTPKQSDLDFRKLEDKIESLQRMLKRNFIK